MRKNHLVSLALASVLICIGTSNVLAAALDPSFGSGGKTYITIPDYFEAQNRSMLILPDGKILVGGWHNNGQNPPVAHLVRYNSDGTPDSSFGPNGVVSYLNVGAEITGIARQADGKIVMVGRGNAGAGSYVFRALPDGSPDTGFGTNGLLLFDIAGISGERAQTVLIQPSGKIVVGGGYLPTGSQIFRLMFVRLNPDGSIDTTFGPSGTGALLGDPGTSSTLIAAPDGSLVSSTYFQDRTVTNNSLGGKLSVVRLSADGAFDNGFGANGYATMDFGTLGRPTRAFGVALQADGKIVAVGAVAYQTYSNPVDVPYRGDWAIGRFNSDGTIDSTFGANGRVQLNFKYRGYEGANTVLVEPSGNIVVAGDVVARFAPNGTLIGKTDRSDLHDPTRFVSNIYALYRQADGKILAAGDGTGLGTARVGLARYLDITSINNSTLTYDFDGDGVSDIGVYRPGASAGADSYWYGFFSMNIGAIHFFQQRYALGEDLPVPGDYDGDRRTDYAVFRPSDGNWYSTTQPDGDLNTHFITVHWGQAGDIPAPADFDGDGTTDRAVYRPSTGAWYVLNSGGGVTALQFGINGDKPVPADYDNDGRADIAVVRDVGGSLVWYILQSSDNALVGFYFGSTGDRIIPTDFDGDGRAELVVFRAGNWFILRNYTTFSAAYWGSAGDIPCPADYDGDGIADLMVYRPSSQAFFMLKSTDGYVQVNQLGLSTDLPIAGAYVR